MQLPDLPLKDLPKGWILDLDGTLVVHNGYKTGEDTILPGVKDFFEKNIKDDDYVLIISARYSEFKGIAEKCLDVKPGEFFIKRLLTLSEENKLNQEKM